MIPVSLSNVKKGNYFTLKNVDKPKSKDLYVKGDYESSLKAYSCYKYDDVKKEIFIKEIKIVYVL
jgi:hypothetical protein